MMRPVLWLAGLVLALGLADGWLAARAARARTADSRVGALFTHDEAEDLRRQPGLRVEEGGRVHAFARVGGEWRCLSLFQAPADGRAVQSLLDELVRAEGIVHARSVEEAPAYDINTPSTLRVSIQGPRALQDPAGDVRATLEIGRAQPGGAGCFVRRRGTKEIWSISSDLRAPLERRVAPGLPPLLAAGAVPAAWLEQGGGSARIALARDATTLVLERRERALDPATVQPGMLPWSWVLDPAGAARELEPGLSGAFVSFLENLAYAGVLDPDEREARGCATPQATITLTSRSGSSLVLAFGTAGPSGRVALWVEATRTLYEVEPEVFALALASSDELTAAHEQEDPWSAALHARESR